MDFKEIEYLAREGKPLSGELPENYVIYAYYSLCALYKKFKELSIDQERAIKEKHKIKIAYERAKDEHEKYLAVYKRHSDQIKLSEEFRCKLHHAINNGEKLEEMFLLACTCIAVLTGDSTLAGSKVNNQLNLLRGEGKCQQLDMTTSTSAS